MTSESNDGTWCMRELVGKCHPLGYDPHAAGIDQGARFDKVTGRSDRKTFPWLQFLKKNLPRVFEHAFCLCLVSSCFSHLVDGWSRVPETSCIM